MYNNITKISKTMVGSTRNPGLPGRMVRNSPGIHQEFRILVFQVGLPGIPQEFLSSW